MLDRMKATLKKLQQEQERLEQEMRDLEAAIRLITEYEDKEVNAS